MVAYVNFRTLLAFRFIESVLSVCVIFVFHVICFWLLSNSSVWLKNYIAFSACSDFSCSLYLCSWWYLVNWHVPVCNGLVRVAESVIHKSNIANLFIYSDFQHSSHVASASCHCVCSKSAAGAATDIWIYFFVSSCYLFIIIYDSNLSIYVDISLSLNLLL